MQFDQSKRLEFIRLLGGAAQHDTRGPAQRPAMPEIG
jgi:hypothetical protein